MAGTTHTHTHTQDTKPKRACYYGKYAQTNICNQLLWVILKINSRNNNNMIITDGEEKNRVAAKKAEE